MRHPTSREVAVNGIAPVSTLAHLLEYDSARGRLQTPVSHDDRSFTVVGHRIMVTAHRDPEALTGPTTAWTS